METAIIVVPYKSRTTAYDFYFLGDVHLGSALCDEAKLKSTLAEVKKNPNARVFLMGDLAEWIGVKDKRFDAGLLAEWVDRGDIVGSELTELEHLLEPIKDKVLGVLDGNHEVSIQRDYSLRVKRLLCEKYGWKDLSYSALVILRFRRNTNDTKSLKLYLHHGYGGGNGYGEANHFTKIFSAYECDWAILGHTHKHYVGDCLYTFVGKNGKLGQRRHLWGRSGTFLQTLRQGSESSYAERAGYLPLCTGALSIRYYPDKEDWVGLC